MSPELRIYYHPSPWRAGINRRPYKQIFTENVLAGFIPAYYDKKVGRAKEQKAQ